MEFNSVPLTPQESYILGVLTLLNESDRTYDILISLPEIVIKFGLMPDRRALIIDPCLESLISKRFISCKNPSDHKSVWKLLFSEQPSLCAAYFYNQAKIRYNYIITSKDSEDYCTLCGEIWTCLLNCYAVLMGYSKGAHLKSPAQIMQVAFDRQLVDIPDGMDPVDFGYFIGVATMVLSSLSIKEHTLQYFKIDWYKECIPRVFALLDTLYRVRITGITSTLANKVHYSDSKAMDIFVTIPHMFARCVTSGLGYDSYHGWDTFRNNMFKCISEVRNTLFSIDCGGETFYSRSDRIQNGDYGTLYQGIMRDIRACYVNYDEAGTIGAQGFPEEMGKVLIGIGYINAVNASDIFDDIDQCGPQGNILYPCEDSGSLAGLLTTTISPTPVLPKKRETNASIREKSNIQRLSLS